MNVTPNKIEIFNKWKDFYEKSFTKISWAPENPFGLYEFEFNKLKRETKENFEKDMANMEKKREPYYEESILHDKLEDIKRIPLVNKDETSLIDNFDKIFKEQYNTLYNIYWTRDNIENYFGNNVNEIKYKKYLDYISDLIYLKLYKDLNMIYILLNTFMETNKITENTNNLKNINLNQNLNPTRNVNKEKAQSQSTQVISNIQKNTAQLNLEIQKCSKKIQKSINNTIKEISNNVNPKLTVNVNPNLTINELNKAVDNCSKKLEINIKDFIKGLNSNNVKEGGTIPSNNTFNSDFLVEVKNLKMDTKQYNNKLKEIKKAYEDGLKDNIKGFKELCKILKEYIENKNKIVTDFINDIRIKKEEENNRIKNIEHEKRKREKYFITEQEIERKNNEIKQYEKRKEEIKEKIKRKEEIKEKNIKDLKIYTALIDKVTSELNAKRDNTNKIIHNIAIADFKIEKQPVIPPKITPEGIIIFEMENIKKIGKEIKRLKDELKMEKKSRDNIQNKIDTKINEEVEGYINEALNYYNEKVEIMKELIQLENELERKKNSGDNIQNKIKEEDIEKENKIKEIDNILIEINNDYSNLIKTESEKLRKKNDKIYQKEYKIKELESKKIASNETLLQRFILSGEINSKNDYRMDITQMRENKDIISVDIFYMVKIEIPYLEKDIKKLHGKIFNLMDEIAKLEGKKNEL